MGQTGTDPQVQPMHHTKHVLALGLTMHTAWGGGGGWHKVCAVCGMQGDLALLAIHSQCCPSEPEGQHMPHATCGWDWTAHVPCTQYRGPAWGTLHAESLPQTGFSHWLHHGLIWTDPGTSMQGQYSGAPHLAHAPD